VAVIGARLTWLAEIAFNVIIVYSSLVAIHLFSLLATYEFDKIFEDNGISEVPLPEGRDSAQGFGDVDLFGVLPILWISVIMLVPMLAWSTTLRSYNARLIIQAWAFCIFVAFLLTFTMWQSYLVTWSEDLLMTIAICKRTEDCFLGDKDQSVLEKILFFKTDYDKCGCTDLCGIMSPEAPMRFGNAMVPRLYPEYVEKFFESDSKTAAYDELMKAVDILGISALIQGSEIESSKSFMVISIVP
jgi:hypothetical protein